MTLIGCSPTEPDEGVIGLMSLLSYQAPRFTALEGFRIESVLGFGGNCCAIEVDIQNEVEGRTVTVFPYYSYTPCPERCRSLGFDSTVFAFDGPGEVRFRVMGEPVENPIAQLDTVRSAMKKWLQRIRGAIGMGLTWAAAWSGVGAILGLVQGVGSLGVGVVVYGIMGLVSGAAFSVVLGITEGRRRFDQMSLPRFAAWGAIPCFLLFALFGGFGGGLLGGMVFGSVAALLGAGSAAGSLALARRAEDKELLRAGEEALGLTEGR